MRAIDIHTSANLVAAVGLDRWRSLCIVLLFVIPSPLSSRSVPSRLVAHVRLPLFCPRFLHVFDFTTRRLTFKAYLKQRLNTVAALGALFCCDLVAVIV